MSHIRIESGNRAPAEIEDYLRKAVRAVGLTQESAFPDPVMQEAYEEQRDLFARILDAMIDEIEALR